MNEDVNHPFPPASEFLRAPDSVAQALDMLPSILDDVMPLSSRHRLDLGKAVRRLWEDLASEREHRNAEYLGAPAEASAYLRYFLPWNLLRLSSIFSTLQLPLKSGDVIADIGSGPLTLPIALLLARPELRSLPLTIYCTDRTERILKLGQVIFENLALKLCGSLPPWKIILVRQSFGAPLPQKVNLLTAANVFNEFFWKIRTPLAARSLQTAKQLTGYLARGASVFLMEPGDPRSGSLISALREALLSYGAHPVAPCPHVHACPMPGLFHGLERQDQAVLRRISSPGGIVMPRRRDKYPWCHFTIGTEKAPAWLARLSGEAGLSKEKLVFSYLLSSMDKDFCASRAPDMVRVVSEAFPLPGARLGRYSCTARGYSLVRYGTSGASVASGDLIPLPPREAGAAHRQAADEFDEKSGAVILSY